MRSDSIGMFWQDIPQKRGAANRVRMQPPIPDTGWTPPKYYPNLSAARVLSVDTETYDPGLDEHGPGWARGQGHICGFSIGTEDGSRWYFPIRHEVEPEMNLNPDHALAWLRDTLKNPNQPKVGANLIYDYGWLKQEGVAVLGELVDVQFAEALLDERARVSLDMLGTKYLKEGKTGELLYKWCSDYYGGGATDIQRRNIYRAPPRLVGPYGEGDADLPIRLAPILYRELQKEGLLELFRMECELIRLLVEMRFAGVHVDIKKAEQLRDVLGGRAAEAHKKLDVLAGLRVDINSAQSLARTFDKLGLSYPRTEPTKKAPTGNPSFTKDFLKKVKHPVTDLIGEIRKLEKLKGTFVESYILEANVNGKVYGSFHPLRGDEGGTRSGRFSSSYPNLQNLPSRDDELAPMVRGLFIPDDGHPWWRRYDYSQIEYRFLIHYATGPGSDEARALFNRCPDTDYHDMTQELVRTQANLELARKPTKNLNFGIVFGMGEDKMMATLGVDVSTARKILDAYHKGMPFVKPTMRAHMDEAKRTGMIRTILGRRSRFDLYEPAEFGLNKPPLPYSRAILEYGRVQRAGVHKGLNRRLQGSAADLIKMAMYRCWVDGVFAETGIPRLTVHDELDFSDPGGKEAAFKEMQHIMETAIPIKIPIRADGDIGPDWGHCTPIPV